MNKLLAALSLCLAIWIHTSVGPRWASAQETALDIGKRFPNAQRLTIRGDIAAELVAGVDRFLTKKISQAESNRAAFWDRSFTDANVYAESVNDNRDRLAIIIGADQTRTEPVKLVRELSAQSASDEYAVTISKVSWSVLEDPDPGRSITSVFGHGILIEPADPSTIVANVIAIPDCNVTPCQISLGGEEIEESMQFAKQLADCRCRVVIPMLVDRSIQQRGRAKLTNREYLYRAGFELGRHLIGYEVQQVRAAIDWLGDQLPLAVIGHGEGGRIAMFAAALDRRIDAACLCGAVGANQPIWSQPIDRNVFGWLREFGDAELLTLIAPRPVLVCHSETAAGEITGQIGGAPGSIEKTNLAAAQREVQRAIKLAQPLVESKVWRIEQTDRLVPPGDRQVVQQLLSLLSLSVQPDAALARNRPTFSIDEERMQEQLVQQLDRHNQLLLRESPFEREAFFRELDTSSLEQFSTSVESYREFFRDQVIGAFDNPLFDPNPRIRKTWQGDGWTGYEVVLDVFEDVIAYGALLVPNGIAPGERRPVVVCQHGLEGRPTDTFLGDHRAYHDYAAALARRGFVTFAPQNLYLFKDQFRVLQRKANPLGKTLFSVIVPQHQQIVNWMKTLSFVDGNRIGFYGLSYGGKSAMRIPALVTDYCLSICSADFNEWVRKNASTRHRFSYVWTGEYEIFEWNLGRTFNYAEMATLICPRPFMVERGHFDGVGTDQWVAYEFAKVRNLYAAKLKIPERSKIEWFDGPHTINGKGTFAFLHRHLNWPPPNP